MSKYNWELPFDAFAKKARTERIPIITEDGKHPTIKHTTGCVYSLYIDENLNMIKPYSTKKDKDKKVLQTFKSYMSREDVIRQAYNWILVYAYENNLYSSNDRFSITFDVELKNGYHDSRVEVGAYFPYNGNDRAYFNAVRDERCSNGLDMKEVVFYSQRLTQK